MLKIQAREIVRYARRNGINLTRGGVNFPDLCARGVLAHALRVEQGEEIVDGDYVYMYKPDVAKHYGLTRDEISGLEGGFETRYHSEQPYHDRGYDKIGRNVARLVGLLVD